MQEKKEKIKISQFLKNHAEWASLMGAIIGCLVIVHSENARLTERLDANMAAVNQRMDAHIVAINQRADDLHREFYELLKEMRKQ